MLQGDDKKHDGGKPRFELIDPDALLALAMVLTGGALDYERDGWLRLNTPEGRHRVVGSSMRHMEAYRREHVTGVAIDSQFAMPHSAHNLACAMFLAAFDVQRLRDMWPIHGVGTAWGNVEQRWREALTELAKKRGIDGEKA